MPIKFNASRWDRFAKAKYRVTNWAEYNEALRLRSDVTVWVGEDAVSGWCAARNAHIDMIANGGRMAWQKAIGYGRRSRGEAQIGRYKQVIGSKLRSRRLET